MLLLGIIPLIIFIPLSQCNANLDEIWSNNPPPIVGEETPGEDRVEDENTDPDIIDPDGNIDPDIIMPGGNTDPDIIMPGGNTDPDIIIPDGNTDPDIIIPDGNTDPDTIVPDESSDQTSDDKNLESKEETITIYHLLDPFDLLGLMGGSAAQEEELNTMNGKGDYYNGEEQAELEETSITGHEQYEELNKQIIEAMETLNDPNATEEEKKEALESIREICKQQQGSYRYVDPLIKEQESRFEENADVSKDSRTEREKEMYRGVIGNYESEEELADGNVSTMDDIINRVEEGEIEILGVEQAPDGDWIITFKNIKDMAVEQSLDGLNETINGCKDLDLAQEHGEESRSE